MIPERIAPVLAELAPLAETFTSAGHRLYLVGGAVRDLLLGGQREDFDLDLTTGARPGEIKALLSGWGDTVWTQGERFGTIGARRGGDGAAGRTVEVTTFRSDVYVDDSRKPQVTFGDDIETDLQRRDFTINAMALELTGDASTVTLVDPSGGAADLATATLRTPGRPEVSFDDDPLRMLRAARFIAGYGFEPVPELVAAVGERGHRLDIVSRERIRDELDKLVVVDRPSPGLWFLVDTGLAEHFLPELPALRLERDPIHRHKDVLSHTIAVVENVQRAVGDEHGGAHDLRLTRLAALFHDVGKPATRGYQPGKGTTFHHHDVVGARMTRRRMEELRYPAADIAAVSELVFLHLRFHTYKMGWSDAAVRRYVRDAGDLLDELNVLTRCDCTTRDEAKAARLSKRMDELEARIAELAEREELAAIRPELDGRAVMEHLDIPPGPVVGAALSHLLDIRLDEGEIGRPEALKRLDAWWQEQSSAD